MVARVRYVEKTGVVIESEAMQLAELTNAISLGADLRKKIAVLVEHLNAIVSDLGDVDVAVTIDGKT